jgi:menaquinol-cytochrome c reductase cytochrome b/c subunit
VVGRPTELTVEAPPAAVRAGGERLAEFKIGRTVAAQSGCLACHRIGDAGNSGPGPDLTHVGSLLTSAGITRAILNPTAPMPSFSRTPAAKLHALVIFLSLLRR